MSAFKVPILKVGDVLLVSIQSDIDDRAVVELQQRVLEQIERTSARAVLIDISLLEMVDSFTGRMLSDIASTYHELLSSESYHELLASESYHELLASEKYREQLASEKYRELLKGESNEGDENPSS